MPHLSCVVTAVLFLLLNLSADDLLCTDSAAVPSADKTEDVWCCVFVIG